VAVDGGARETPGTDLSQQRPCLVHLVRAANGPKPFSSFLDSYRAHPAGVEHDLILAMKGFSSRDSAAAYLDGAADLRALPLFFPDDGLDLSIYVEVARRLGERRYCFVNSFSTVLTENWLACLSNALAGPSVGLVGASGSWASPRSQALHAQGLPSAYKTVFPDRRWMREQFEELERERAARPRGALRGALHRADRWLMTARAAISFAPFPAPHLRTNAFMITGGTLAQLGLVRPQRKFNAYQLESGRKSVTRRVQRLGLGVVVVDRMGRTFEPDRWDRSLTFWQHDQEGLLVADNQTATYQRGDRDRRRLLSGYAWGEKADPVLDTEPPGLSAAMGEPYPRPRSDISR
jgi:hypothetical protein